MENRFALPEEEEAAAEPEAAPLALVETDEDFVIERSGEALAQTLAPPPRVVPLPPARAAAPPPPAPAVAPVTRWSSSSSPSEGPSRRASGFEPVFRPLDDRAGPGGPAPGPAPPAERLERPSHRATREAGAVPAYPASFESVLPATMPGVQLSDLAGSALASPTLAEIYFGQGAYDQAIQTYEEVLRREPANDAARARLAEIGALVAEQALAAEAGGAEGRRAVLLRTIARLEALLVAVGRK